MLVPPEGNLVLLLIKQSTLMVAEKVLRAYPNQGHELKAEKAHFP